MKTIACCLFVLALLVGSQASFSAPTEVAESELLAEQLAELSELLNSSRYSEVITKGTQYADAVRQKTPDGSLHEARLLDMVVTAGGRSEQLMDPKIMSAGLRAVELKKATVGPESNGYAVSLVNLAVLHSYRYELGQAIHIFDQAIAILEKLGPDFDEMRARVLSSQGVSCRRLGQPKRAMERYQQALEIQNRVLGPDHPDVASSLHNMSMIYSSFGEYGKALDANRRALAIREAHFGPNSEWVAETCNNLATDLAYMAEYEESIEQQARSVSIYAEQLGTDHPRYWLTRMNLAIGYLDMGDHHGAVPRLEAVVEGLSRVFGPNHVQLTWALDSLAGGYRLQGDPERALATLERSLALSEAAYGKNHYDTTFTMMEFGPVLMDLERFDEAAAILHRCLAIQEAGTSPTSMELCDLLSELSDVHLLMGEVDEALRFADRSLEILRLLGEDIHPLLAQALIHRARALSARGDRQEALLVGLEAEDVSRRHLQLTMPALSERRALDYASSRVDGLNLAASLLRGGDTGAIVAQVWDSEIRSRAAVLDEFSGRNLNLRDHPDPVVQALSDSSLAVRERIANLSLRGPGYEDDTTYVATMAAAREQLDQIESRRSKASAGRRGPGWDRKVGYDEVRASLTAGQALVAYFRVKETSGSDDSRYLAFVLADSRAEPMVLDLGPAEMVETRIMEWRDQVAGVAVSDGSSEGETGDQARGFVRVPRSTDQRLANYRQAASGLRQLIWDPVASRVESAERVFLALDGDLHLVNFGALSVGESEFLVEQDQIHHILVDERSLARVDTDSGGSQLLALGDPEFQALDSVGEPAESRDRANPNEGPCRDARPMEFQSLPGSAEEVNLVRELWDSVGTTRSGSARILQGDAATEAALKSGLDDVGVMHLATHGFFLADSCSEQKIEDSRWHNPLVLSGLALAGANRWRDAAPGLQDGILTAEEVAALDLGGVRWAVLSACDTGLGVSGARGEGVFGLQRAFRLAGARTVIMSLWSVQDVAAREWMEALYRARWQEDLDTAESVRAATQAVLKSRREEGRSQHPYYWAGFVAAGEWR